MKPSQLTLHTSFLAAALFAATAAQAAPVGVDGTLGTEWAGVTATTVGYDAAAPTSNFGTPGLNNHNVGYSVYYRADATYLYGLLRANGDTGGLNFANLYFNTDLVGGSDLGIELDNNRSFKPGANGYYDLTGYLSVAHSLGNLNHVIEWSLSWAYINSNPDSFLPAGTNSANGIQLRLSQAFGYSVAGGDMNPATFAGPRFGTVAQAAANTVPEPASLALAACALLAAAAVRRQRRG
jgi:hypothetical protein